jgi:transposase InsO family protein
MDERLRFVQDVHRPGWSFTEICRRYEVSRKTGYKWIARYHGEGAQGCNDRLRSPRNHPNKTRALMVKQVIRARRKHPGWGPRTLHAYLIEQHPDVAWPCPSTIGAILKRHGLVKKRRRRTSRMAWRPPRTRPDRPNRVWTADFKGQFRLGNGTLCYPLTVVDAFSRYLLVSRALRSTAVKPARRVFEEAFREYGLPEIIHTDNGVPFCFPSAPLALSTLSVWFLKLGIGLERSRPGKPQDNGSHERMHRTLKEEVAHPPRYSLVTQQRALDRFRRCYNEERPHHALNLETPARRYTPSPRPNPDELKAAELIRSTDEEKDLQVAAVRAWQQRNAERAPTALRQLQQVAAGGGNVFAALMDSVKVASLGQLSQALYEVGGQYRRNM